MYISYHYINIFTDMFFRFGDIICEYTMFNVPVISVKNKYFIKIIIEQCGKYPIRPPNEVTANYRKSRPDRYSNTGLDNEYVFVYIIDTIEFKLHSFNFTRTQI